MLYQPWANNDNWETSDSKMVELASAEIQFSHTNRLVESIDISPSGIILLRGPRQIGKSTLLRQFVKKCLKNGILAQSIVLFDVEQFEDRFQLAGEIKAFVDSSIGYSIVLLDEFTSIDKWWLALKTLADSGVLANTLVLGTGSSSFDLAEGADLMPGRRGERYPVDYELLPLSYKDVAKTLSLEEYFLTGGFPRTINQYLKLGLIPPYVYDLYGSWITGLFIKRHKAVYSIPHLLHYLSKHTSSSMSVQRLTRECGIGSNHTAEAYLEILERGYALLTANWSNPDGKGISLRKNRKFYPFDPFLYHIFKNYSKGWNSAFAASKENINDVEQRSVLVELIIASEIRKRTGHERLTYWVGKKEIDFITDTLIEVKYRNRVSLTDFKWVEPMLSDGRKLTVITKDINAHDGAIELVDIHRWLTEN